MIRKYCSLLLHYATVALLSCSILLFSDMVYAAENIASFQMVRGIVHILHKGTLPAVVAKNGDMLSSGDIVRTKSDSSADVAFIDGSLLKISPRSRVDMGVYFDGQNKNIANVKLARGRVETVVPKGATGRTFEVQTPNAICGVRGTDWLQSYDVDANTTGLAVIEGSVYSYNLNNPTDVVTVLAGNFTTITGNAAPRPPAPGSGSFSGAVPFGYSAASGGSKSFDSLNSLVGTMMAVPPPPPPPSSSSQLRPQTIAVQPTATQVSVNPSFN